jgi:hypothetical protein
MVTKFNKHNYSKKKTKKGGKEGKKWVTAYKKASKTLKNTGSLKQAKVALKKQALANARKLFGSVGKL